MEKNIDSTFAKWKIEFIKNLGGKQFSWNIGE